MTSIKYLNSSWPNVGAKIYTPWSSNVILLEILLIHHNVVGTFYGIRSETRDKEGWPLDSKSPLWVYDDNKTLRLWQEFRQCPRTQDLDNIEDIIGHYESNSGKIYYAVKWSDYACPTWELEEDMLCYDYSLNEYYMHFNINP